MNTVWPTKSIRIFHGISTDINVWIGTKHFHGTTIEYILRLGDRLPCLTLMSTISGGALIFVYSGNQRLFMQNNAYISVCLYDSLVAWQTMYYSTQSWSQLKTHSKKSARIQTGCTSQVHFVHTHFSLCWLLSKQRKCVWHCGNVFISLCMKRKWIPYGLGQLSQIHE